MLPDEVYQTLINAGFQVAIAGQTFVVSLITRRVSVAEVEAALNYPEGVWYESVGGTVIVHC